MNAYQQLYSNAQGYGFWCNDKCVAEKKAAGIPPLGGGSAIKQTQADSDALLAQAALIQAQKEDKSLSGAAIAGIIGVSLLGIALMVVIIKKTRKAKQ